MTLISLPKSIEAENVLIGLILKDNSLYWEAVKYLKPKDFYVEQNQKVWAAFHILADEGDPLDPVLAIEKIQASGFKIKLEDFEIYNQGLPATPKINEYIKLIREKSVQRQKAKLHTEAQNAILGNRDEEYKRIQAKIEELENSLKTEEPARVETHGEEVLQKAYDRGESGLILTGLRTGFKKLDALTGGLQPESLIIIAARPRMGKSSLGLNISKNVTIANKDAVVLIYSLEMSYLQLMIRLLAQEARINSMRVKNGLMTLEEWARLIGAYDRLKEGKLIIDDTFNVGIGNLRARAKQIQKEYKRLDLIIIDHIQLMNTERAATRNDEMTKLSRSLKFLAKEFKIPVIAMSQLNRGSENRSDHRPQLSDLRESGAIEQDADIVAFIHREEVYKKTDDNQNLAELILAKHREGDQGTIDLYWCNEYTRFEDLTMIKH